MNLLQVLLYTKMKFNFHCMAGAVYQHSWEDGQTTSLEELITMTAQTPITTNSTNSTATATAIGAGPSPPAIIALKIIPLVFIIVVSLCGNLLLVHVVLSDVRMRTSTNFFVVSQSVADVGTTVLVIPFACFAVITDAWTFDSVLCTANAFFNMCFTIATLLNLAVIAFDRFLAIVKSSHHTIGTNAALGVITLVWALALVGGIPWLGIFSDRVDVVYFRGFYTCAQEFKHPIRASELAVLLIQIFSFAFLPFVAIVYSFNRILKVIRGNRHRVSPSALSNSQKIAVEVYSKTAYTSLAVIATSLVQVFPACFLMTIEGLIVSPIPHDLETALKWIMWCHCWIKPVIYAKRSRQWSKKFRSYLPSVSRCRSGLAVRAPAGKNDRRTASKFWAEAAKTAKTTEMNRQAESVATRDRKLGFTSRGAWVARGSITFHDISQSITSLAEWPGPTVFPGLEKTDSVAPRQCLSYSTARYRKPTS